MTVSSMPPVEHAIQAPPLDSGPPRKTSAPQLGWAGIGVFVDHVPLAMAARNSALSKMRSAGTR